jgi:anaerobic ribonucleoside-triphosphate reductase activating protein
MSEELLINVAALEKGTRMAGPRLRDAIWVQGCSIRCPGCANQAYLPNVERVRIPVSRLVAHFRARASIIDGCSILGGEPTEQPLAVGALLKEVKVLGLSTVVFSGRTLESLRRDPKCRVLLESTDLLIDGPYIASQRDTALHWRGSNNQCLHLLSDMFNESDLVAPDVAGEVTISDGSFLFHGVGTMQMPRQRIADAFTSVVQELTPER